LTAQLSLLPVAYSTLAETLANSRRCNCCQV
jgi:hypothetical protein